MKNSDWKEVKLNEVGFVGRGKSRHRPRNAEFLYGGDYPFVQTGDIKASEFYLSTYSQTYSEDGLKQSKLWNEGTLCITIAANIAETAVLTIKACFPDSVIGFVPFKDKSDVRFIKYSFDILKLHFQSISQGTTQDNLSLEKLLSINFTLPPLPTQQKIADILGAYDELIENNRRRIALLENMAAGLYKEWFVRMRPHGQILPTNAETGLPEGWEVVRFSDFIKLNRGFDLPDEKMEEGICPVIASTGIKGFHSSFKVKGPCVTTGRSGSLGTVIYEDRDSWPLNTSLYVKDFKGNSPIFVYYTLKELNLETFNSGAGVPTLNQNHLHNLKLPLPRKELQNEFEQITVSLFNQIKTLQEQTGVLRRVRDRLLPRLMSGELGGA